MVICVGFFLVHSAIDKSSRHCYEAAMELLCGYYEVARVIYVCVCFFLIDKVFYSASCENCQSDHSTHVNKT